jgi:hypothetical protein
MKTLILSNRHSFNSFIVAMIVMLISIINACNEPIDQYSNESCFAQNLGDPVPNSNFPSWPIIDEKREMMYYFDPLHHSLVRVDMKNGSKDIVSHHPDFEYLNPFEIVDSLLFAHGTSKANEPGFIYKINLNTKNGSTIIENAHYPIPIDDSGKIIYQSEDQEIYVSDFNGIKSKLDIQGTPLSYSKSNNLLLVREYLPVRVSTFNLESKQIETVKHENIGTSINYYWSNNEIVEVLEIDNSNLSDKASPKSLTITNLTKNEIIGEYEDYFAYAIFPKSNTLALEVEANNNVCKNQQFILCVEDLTSNKRYEIADSGHGYFSNFHIYENKETIVYWESNSQNFWLNAIQ